MARPQHDPLRALTAGEAVALQRVVKASSERHDRRQRAGALLAVAGGASFRAAAEQAGYQRAESVSQVVARFNQHGVAALDIAGGRGRKPTYGPVAQERILQGLARPPQRRADGTASWSLVLLERALRQEAGLEHLSASTIRGVLHAAGYRWQRTRSWCPTGTARRQRQGRVVTVVDPQATRKRGRLSRRTRERRPPR